MDAKDNEVKVIRTDRLSAIETNLALLAQEVRLNNNQLQRLVARHDTVLIGSEDKPGLATKVDRLEQSETRRVWHVRALWTTLLAAVAKLGADHFIK